MGQVTTTAQINAAQLADALGGNVAITFYGAKESSTAEKTVEVAGKTDQEITTALAGITYDPNYTADLTKVNWRTKLEAEIAWLTNEIATLPADGTTTSGNSVNRIDLIIQHLKRVDRDIVRLMEFVLNHTLDSGA